MGGGYLWPTPVDEGEAVGVLMTGFGWLSLVPVAGGKFHHDDHGVLRTRDGFLCTMMLR